MNQYIQLKKQFFSFFQSRGYQNLPSSNLIINDPNLLFTVAGMVQFKDIFLKTQPKIYDRVITIQKCLRVGGKHNDLDNVGFTKRHNTFFEMMGHFAFYDDNYSKEQIIKDAVDFLLTQNLNLEYFWVTIDYKDEESYGIWQKILPENRIIKELSGENFWSMGDDGPCGFCTEILYDREYNNDYNLLNHQDILKNNERFLEIWNIVFMTKVKHNGVIMDNTGLSIDTGMGLERLLSIIENVDNNFDTSALKPIIDTMKNIIKEGPDHLYKICADHIRAILLLLDEGLEPSASKQGYVLKKLIRRCIFYYYPFHSSPLLHLLIPITYQLLKEYIMTDIEILQKKLYDEELKIIHHWQSSQDIIIKYMDKKRNIEGNTMFFLYDTMGVNLSMMEDYAETQGITLDYDNFYNLLEIHKQQSQNKIFINDAFDGTIFLGYENYYDENMDYTGNILGVYNISGGDIISNEESLILISDKTWFFPESCGQIGDIGQCIINGKSYEIINTIYCNTLQQKVIGHIINNPEKDNLKEVIGKRIFFNLNFKRRLNIARNHTGTHLLNKAFEEIIGPSEQKGSWVGDNKFRWDVAVKNINNEDVNKMENLVNDMIKKNITVDVLNQSLEIAKKENYTYLKNTYYNSDVRCVNIGQWSKELCHGTHVKSTGEILGLKIIKKKSISCNVVRFECITGDEWQNFNDDNQNKSINFLKPYEKNEKILFLIKELENAILNNQNNLIIKIYNKIYNLDESIKNIKDEIPCLNSEILRQDVIKNIQGEGIIIQYNSVDILLYDHYKYKFSWVILIGINGGIIIGSEDNIEMVNNLYGELKKIFDIKGSNNGRLFRGKILNTFSWEIIVDVVKNFIKK